MDRIRKRKSVRAYESVPLDVDEVKPIIGHSQKGIFGNTFEIKVYSAEEAKEIGINRFSSYGAITGNPAYILAIVSDERLKLVDYGFCLENVVLDLTAQGYGTCWIGNMPNKNKIERQLGIDSVDNIPALISVGKRNSSMKWHQKIREKGRKDKRTYDQLFFSDFIGNPLKGFHHNAYKEVFEAIQNAPSTMNKQPWRIVLEDHKFKFYMTSDYVTEQSRWLKYIDMGIALSHFLVAIQTLEKKGKWVNEVIQPLNKYEYITSFQLENDHIN